VYKCAEMRSTPFGGALSDDKLEQAIHEHAAQGRQLKSTSTVDVKGASDPRGTDRLLVTVEREKE
jgi:cyanate lyase